MVGPFRLICGGATSLAACHLAACRLPIAHRNRAFALADARPPTKCAWVCPVSQRIHRSTVRAVSLAGPGTVLSDGA